MSRLLIKHAHLIVDGYRQFIDGAILIDEKSIIEVYPHTNKVDVNEESIDIEGKILMPSFVKEEVFDNNQIVVDPLNIKGLDKDKKIMIGNSKALSKDINIDYDGFYNLFINMSGFNYKDFGLVNEAFKTNKYCEIDGSLDESVINVIYKLIRKDKIILFKNINKGIVSFKNVNADLNELLLFTSLNAYTLFNMQDRYGSLIKGKSSSFVILNDKLEIVKEIN